MEKTTLSRIGWPFADDAGVTGVPPMMDRQDACPTGLVGKREGERFCPPYMTAEETNETKTGEKEADLP